MRILASIVLVTAMCGLWLKLATAPLYARYDADECSRAYSHARTHADSGRVDLHPFKGADDRKRHTCKEVRVRSFDGTFEIPGLRQPKAGL